jgi:hypothetical protein
MWGCALSKHLERVRGAHADAVAGRLSAPPSFIAATPEQIAADVNGCGALGAKFDFVPETIYGLRVSPACYVHDWDYTEGRTEQDKRDADARFLRNMLWLVESAPGVLSSVLRIFRRRRALVYYEAVVEFGHTAFWRGKNG